LGTARFEADVETGKVTVTPLMKAPQTEKGRAVWTGDTVTFTTSDLAADQGNLVSRRTMRVSVRNNGGERIGLGSGVRLVFNRLASGFSPASDRRSLAAVSTVAGNGTNGVVDGFGTAAATVPTAIAALSDGSFAVLEATRMRLLRNGTMSTMRGGITNGAGLAIVRDPGTGAEFAMVGDRGGHVVRMVEMSTGATTVFAGTGVAGDVVGAANVAQFNNPMGIAWDESARQLYVADQANGKLKRIAVSFGGGRPVAGAVGQPFVGLTSPTAVAIGPGGTVAASESTIHRVRLFVNGVTSIQIGTGTAGYAFGDGSTAQFSTPSALAYFGNTLYVANGGNGALSAITPMPDMSPINPRAYAVGLIAGQGLAGYDEGRGDVARFGSGIAGLTAAQSRLLVADTANRRVRAVDLGDTNSPSSTENVVTLTNRSGLLDFNGHSGAAPFILRDVVVEPGQTVDLGTFDFEITDGVRRFSFDLLMEAGNGAVMTPDAVTSPTSFGAGSPNAYVRRIVPRSVRPVDGPLGASALGNEYVDLEYDGLGNLYVVDGNSIRRMDAKTQQISTIAGVHNQPDNIDGTGSTARFAGITDIAVTADGATLYVSQSNHVIRVISRWISAPPMDRSSYFITTVVGQAGVSGNVGGVGTAIRLNNPHAIALSADDRRMFVKDDNGSQITGITILSSNVNLPEAYVYNEGTPLSPGAVTEMKADRLGSWIIAQFDGTQYNIMRLSERNWTFTSVTNSTGINETDQDGPNGKALTPQALAADKDGNVWFMSAGNGSTWRVRRVGRVGGATTVAGGGTQSIFFGSNTGDRVFLNDWAIHPRRGAVSPNGEYAFVDSGGLHTVSRVVRN
jgi:sugar lactone lactonase YvrE